MKLLIDLTQTDVPAYFQRLDTEVVQENFGYYQNDYLGPKCDKCGRLLHIHLWQAVDDLAVLGEAGAVLECSEAA